MLRGPLADAIVRGPMCDKVSRVAAVRPSSHTSPLDQDPAGCGAAMPDVSVVAATHNRRELVELLLRALERQTIGIGRFEVIVVDDGSSDGTPAFLAEERDAGRLFLQLLGHERPLGASAARNAGWAVARAPLVAFTDDDCEPTPQWLERGLRAWHEDESAIVQGATRPRPRERLSPFTRSIEVVTAGPPWETCNIFYPRALLERLDGFDAERLPNSGSGEDTDLAWRAVGEGTTVRWTPEAEVHHAVLYAGPVGMLRHAWHWHRLASLFKLHPELKPLMLHRGIMFAPQHEHVLRALLALLLPRRWWPISVALAAPYIKRLAWRRSGPLLAPYLIAVDLTEMAGVLRGAIRERVWML